MKIRAKARGRSAAFQTGKKPSFRILCAALLALLLTASAVPAMADTVIRECGADDCPSMTFEEICQGTLKEDSSLSPLMTRGSMGSLWGSKTLWTEVWSKIQCTKCGNTFAHYRVHLHLTLPSALFGENAEICLMSN